MIDPAVPLVIPAMAGLYAGLAPAAEALLRLAVGLTLLAHGLRMAFGFFPDTGLPTRNVRMLAESLQRWGYRPAQLWAPIIAATLLGAGPLLAIGLLSRPAALPIVILLAMSVFERWRAGCGFFWNKQGLEYPLIWALAAFYFLVHGGGAYSVDRLLGVEF
jgi:putative oxidoreductase